MTNSERIMLMPKWNGAMLAVALLAVPASAQAQTVSAIATEPATDRVAAAAQLIELIMPPGQRDAMFEQMLEAIMGTLTSGLKERPDLVKALEDPQVEAVFDRFVARQKEQTAEQLKAGMPEMLTAMSRAYARRFTVAQLTELRTFFGSPTGQAYARESMGILSDPDIVAWQRGLMTDSFEKLPGEMELLRQELEEVLGKPLGKSKA